MVRRHADTLEHERPALREALACAAIGSPRDPRKVERNEQRRDATGTRTARPREHHAVVCEAGERDRSLLAVDDPVIALAPRGGADRGGVGARSGLRQPERNHALARGQCGKDRALDALVRVSRQQIADDGGQLHEEGEVVVAARDLLGGDAGHDVARSQSPVLFGYAQAHDAERCELSEAAAWQRFTAVPAGVLREEAIACVPSYAFLERQLRIVELELHRFIRPIASCKIVRCGSLRTQDARVTFPPFAGAPAPRIPETTIE